MLFLSVGVRTDAVLRSGVGVGGGAVRSRVGVGVVEPIRTALVRIDGHEVLHVLRLFETLLRANAPRRREEDDGGDEQLADADPGDDVRPAVVELGHAGVFQHLQRKTTKILFFYLKNFFFFLHQATPSRSTRP